MGTLWLDVRYAVRVLLKSPGFVAVAVLALALGIGANTAIFSVVNAVLLKPLPYPGADRIIAFDGVNPSKGIGESNMSAPDFFDWQSQSRAFEAMAMFATGSGNMTGGDEPERVASSVVTSGFFPAMGVGAALGRTLLPEDDRLDAPPVAVISQGLWRRRFGSDPGVLGRRIEVSGRSREVVGVMPAGFDFPERTEIWSPLRMDVGEEPRDNRSYDVVARLREGVRLEEARAEMDTVAAQLAQAYPVTNAGWGVELERLKDEMVGGVRTMLLVLLGAVALVLLIACANVANLMLTRAATRRKEVAIRLALGAGRLRVVRQLLIESLLLALAGGAFGMFLSLWLLDALVAMSPADTPRLDQAGFDAGVFAFAAAVTCLTGIIFGLAPALQSSKPDLHDALKEGGRGSTEGRSRLRGALVVSEVALSLVLLIGAGLLVRSFARLGEVNPGFDAEKVLTMRVALPGARYPEPRKRAEFYESLAGRVRALAGVESAGAVLSLPLGGSNYSVGRSFIREGRPATPEESANAMYAVVTPDYFRTLRIPLVAGRTFTERDGDGSPMVVVINETMARRHFAGEDPLGKRITIWRDEKFPREVVGVVGDVKSGLDEEAGPQVYVPHAQDAAWGGMSLVVRTQGDPLALARAVRGEVRALDRDLPVFDVKTMGQVLANAAAYRRFSTVLMTAFAAVAALLAAVGLYGVVSYSVTQRTHEIGIRVALGAQRRDVLRLVMRQGGALALAGVGFGLAGALAATRAMSSLLYEVSATDPLVFALVPVLLIAVALLACYIPARRATKVDPMVALRYE